MSQSLKWRAALVVVVVGLGILFLLPSLLGSAEKSAKTAAVELEELLAVEGVEGCDVEAASREVMVRTPDAEAADRVTELLREQFPQTELIRREAGEEGISLALRPPAETGLPRFLPQKRLNLGLDLQGGLHLVLEVQVEKAVDDTVARVADELKTAMQDERIRTRRVEVKGREIRVVLRDADAAEAVAGLLADDFRNLREVRREPVSTDLLLVLGLTPEEAQQIRDYAVRQGIETIRNRVDQFGVAEPTIVPQGQRRILIQLPGIEDQDRAVRLLEKTAHLEFRLLEEGMSPSQALKQGAPTGTEVLYEREVDPISGETLRKIPYLVQKRVLMTGDVLTDARVQIRQDYNEPYVSLEFDKRGARIFERITGENVKRRLAIVLDAMVQSAPVIQERIAGGRAQITGRFSDEEARDLAIALRSGSLPAPVEILERRSVGPSLGQDSIRAGRLSMAVGGALVVAFMVLYYRKAGVLADFALTINVILIMGTLAAFSATLTLPGIAGIVLTIGMAVDANVLIFERIREEVRLGKTPANAVESGYSKALVTILDANATTFIAAAVLWQYGTGPIKGFAVTLVIGIVASLFTAIVGTRLIFDWILHRGTVRRLSI
jgi:preprotein translocase subunit SecD